MTLDEGRPAIFFLSIDVPQQSERSTLVAGVHETLRRHQIKALWSFEFQGHCHAVETVAASASDVGLLANEDWAHPNCDRTQFARELLARVNQANDLGIKPIAFTLPTSDPPNFFDLLVKYQMSIIRTRTDKISGMAHGLHPRLARYGIWETEPTLVLPSISRWSFPWTAKRKIQRAIDGQQLIHVSVNVAALSQNQAAGLRSLDSVLKLVEVRREAGVLQTVSAHELLEIYCPRRERLFSRSVLRAA